LRLQSVSVSADVIAQMRMPSPHHGEGMLEVGIVKSVRSSPWDSDAADVGTVCGGVPALAWTDGL